MSRFLIFCILPIIACAPSTQGPQLQDEDAVEARISIELTDAETLAVLDLANTASFEELDQDVSLDRRAAEGIVELRPFATLDELDAVPYVGDVALEKLRAYLALPPVDAVPVQVHGVEEGTTLAQMVLSIANEESEVFLDDTLGLDRRAAAGIVELRPFASLTELDSVAYVGAAAFARLVEEAEVRLARDVDGDGVTAAFDCDDADPNVHPGAVEYCGDVDCSGAQHLSGAKIGTTQYATLQDAVDAATPGDHIDVCAVGRQTTTIDKDLTLERNRTGMLLYGGTATDFEVMGAEVTFIDLPISRERPFLEATNAIVHIEGFRSIDFDGGDAPISVTDSTLTMTRGLFAESDAAIAGAVIGMRSDIFIDDFEFRANEGARSSSVGAGAVVLDTGSLTIDDSTFLFNDTNLILVRNNHGPVSVDLRDNTYQGAAHVGWNYATGDTYAYVTWLTNLAQTGDYSFDTADLD